MSELRVDWIACDGHGLCADLLPELVDLDDWGYPILREREVPEALRGRAKAAIAACPALALRAVTPQPRPPHRP